MRTALLTGVTLAAFAANSLLCRMALEPGSIDPLSFTALRVASGALVLAPLPRLLEPAGRLAEPAGSWISALALFVYAIGFSLAYVTLNTGTGALVLFGTVQATMIGVGIVRGERPGTAEWLGLTAAMAGLVWLVLPGLAAPDPAGVLMMSAAGAAWGVYSLRGRGIRRPIAATAGNFLRAAPLALVVAVPAWSTLSAEPRGILLAVASGALTSGIGYVIWYMALRGLAATPAAIVQLAVPVLAALAGVVFLAERPTLRLGVAGVLILGGIATAILLRGADRR